MLSCGSREFSDGFWQFAETRSRLCGILLASSSETGAVVGFENYILSLLVQMSVLPSIWKIIHQHCNWEGASGKIYIFVPSDYFHVRALSEGCPHSTLPSPVCHVLPPVSYQAPLVNLPVPPLNTIQHSEMNAAHCAWSLFEWRALGPHLRLFDWQQAGWALHETRAHVRLDICAVCVKGLDDFNSHAPITPVSYVALHYNVEKFTLYSFFSFL